MSTPTGSGSLLASPTIDCDPSASRCAYGRIGDETDIGRAPAALPAKPRRACGVPSIRLLRPLRSGGSISSNNL
ncbi:hypothetical protein BRADI_2g27163v3 [Brachypodium distachyon]|uniref:Uncharacterized protein n=1 Tax=Brachypodium distachyon TaxID=15368 RepID=A0A2K2DAX7_BRADI|nr:hypothetical protein BRADI_2g27163v3 [Brachypodium distachyon]